MVSSKLHTEYDTHHGVKQPGADTERYRCAFTKGLAGRGDGYQCGLDWGVLVLTRNSLIV